MVDFVTISIIASIALFVIGLIAWLKLHRTHTTNTGPIIELERLTKCRACGSLIPEGVRKCAFCGATQRFDDSGG